MANLRTFRPEIGDVGALVVGGDFKCASRAGGGLLEDEDDFLLPQSLLLGPILLGFFQLFGEIEEVNQLLLGEKTDVEQILSLKSDWCSRCHETISFPNLSLI